MEFKDKVVIVTGASSGIGSATSVFFANQSAKVVLVGRNEEKLKKVAKQVENAKDVKPLIVKADLQIDSDVKRIVDETVKHFGRIDILVNNAGVGVVAGIKDGIQHFENMISINLRSVYLLTGLAVPFLIKTKGNIVNVSSNVSIKAVHDFLPYCVSKAGLDMFTKCIAEELAVYGIRVNSVNPGPVDSEFHLRLGFKKEKTYEMMEYRKNMSPLKKIFTSEEIAQLILFLASDQAQSTTGSIYFVDNAFTL